MADQFDIRWVDRGHEPQCPPNPAYPDGIDVIAARPGKPSCKVALPYPAKRIGVYLLRCRRCGDRTVLTTAGRPDDPRSVTVECAAKPH